MKRASLLLVLPAVAALFFYEPFRLPAQPAAAWWRLEGGAHVSTVRESTARGYAALPASTLVSLGAELSYAGGDVVARFGARRVVFSPGAAAVTVDGAAHPLAEAVYDDGGVLYVPVSFFRDALPALSGGGLAVDAAGRVLRGALPAPAREPAVSAAPAPAPAPDTTPRLASSGRPAPRRLVVVDAGHGGRDPGARGADGTREKDVTLAVARRLAALLREDATLEVRMTRDRDTLIALRDRARFANNWKDEGQPALFISIHCNANPSRAADGFETYFLSEAKTADAKRVEEMENAAMQYEEDSGERSPLEFIMQDLRQNQYLRESSAWAQMIQDRLREVHPGPDRGVKQAGFAVLNHTFMPAVLVEIGFISNRDEERLLRDRELQDGIARQLAAAVRDFFRRPVPGRTTD
jgi:N-acetylmuramoyl-L-alanine amidase